MLVAQSLKAKRYAIYFSLGTFVELVRLIVFRMVEDRSFLLANIMSLAISILVSFVVHERITWKDREGTISVKFIRFCESKALLWVAKLVILPLMTFIGITCPLMEEANWFMQVFALISEHLANALTVFISCGVLQATILDFLIGFTVGYLLHDGWSFKSKKA
jgi:putative flippase GtrA